MKLSKAWIRGKLKRDWARFRLFPYRRFFYAVAPILYFATVLAIIFGPLVYNREERLVDNAKHTKYLDQLREQANASAKAQSQLDANDEFLQQEMRGLHLEVAKATEEIRYYRDQMEVIIKTCPGRVHAPHLPWKPEHVSESK